MMHDRCPVTVTVPVSDNGRRVFYSPLGEKPTIACTMRECVCVCVFSSILSILIFIIVSRLRPFAKCSANSASRQVRVASSRGVL